MHTHKTHLSPALPSTTSQPYQGFPQLPIITPRQGENSQTLVKLSSKRRGDLLELPDPSFMISPSALAISIHTVIKRLNYQPGCAFNHWLPFVMSYLF